MTLMQSRTFRLSAMALAFVLSAGTAYAQEKQSGEWEYELAPMYLWGMSQKGNARFGPVSAPVDVEFKDAVKDLSGILTFYFEGRNPRWGYYANFSWLRLTPESQLPTGQTVSTDLRTPLVEVAGMYRLGTPGESPWWLVGGVRYMGMNVDVSGLPSPPLPFNSIKVTQSITDAFVGGRYRRALSDRWTFLAQADVGTGTSRVVWSATALFNYRFHKHAGVLFGYRWLDYDVNESDFVWDVTMQGPLLALNFGW